MAHTTPTEFVGTPVLTADNVALIREWYVSALAAENMATDPEDNAFHTGQREAFEDVLQLLHGIVK